MPGISIIYQEVTRPHLHIIAPDDLWPHFIGLKSDLPFGQHANNEKGHVPCAYFVKHLQQNALK